MGVSFACLDLRFTHLEPNDFAPCFFAVTPPPSLLTLNTSFSSLQLAASQRGNIAQAIRTET
jgi:hypothetical protein